MGGVQHRDPARCDPRDRRPLSPSVLGHVRRIFPPRPRRHRLRAQPVAGLLSRGDPGARLRGQIEMLLENAVVVAWALVIGGFGILLVERFAKPRESGGVAALSTRQSILIGLVQCPAMIPGGRRPGATVMGAVS